MMPNGGQGDHLLEEFQTLQKIPNQFDYHDFGSGDLNDQKLIIYNHEYT